MALYYNNTNISSSNNIYINNVAQNKVYYNNNLVWEHNLSLYPGQTWLVRGNSTSETYYSPPTVIVRANPDTSSAIYTAFDAGPWNYLIMNYSVLFVGTYGQGLVGYGDFNSFAVNAWPSVIGIGWSNSISTGHTDPNGNNWGSGVINKTFTLTISLSGVTGTQYAGIACTARSSLDATTHLVLNSAYCS